MTRRMELMMWLGLFAAPVAFAIEHVFGWGITEHGCESVGNQLLAAVAALIAAGGIAAAWESYASVRGTENDDPPPVGRVWLLSLCGIVVSSVLLVLILLTLAGVLLLDPCHQA